MNILISCPGRRVRTVEILRNEFAKAGLGTIATGNSTLIPGLYPADKAFIVPSVQDDAYIPRMLEICREENVKAILSMLDEDVLSIARAANDFRALGVVPIVPPYKAVQICNDKYETYQFMNSRGIKCARTYVSLEEFTAAYQKKELDFPVFIKPVVAAGSRGAMKCNTMQELEMHWRLKTGLLIQEYLDGPEYSLDVYIDTISRKMVSVFCKQKLAALNGTYVKAISVKDRELFALAESLAKAVEAVGPLDIEIFKVNDEYKVGEINTRMGGGYFTAYACGVNFAPLVVNNIEGLENEPYIGNYVTDVLLLRYDKLLVKKRDAMLQSPYLS